MELSENAKKIFKDLYCFQGETIEDTFKRVAKDFGTNEEEQTAYDLLSDGIWRPNTPVFLNAGTKHKVFSACYVVGLEDSMDSIYNIANVARRIFQYGAGIGIPIGNLREKEAYIYEGEKDKPPEGRSSGPISFMKLYDAVGETTKSGGRVRRAAILCAMPVWHPDIKDFIKCKEIDGRLANMNISVLITDKFMQALEDGTPFDLITPMNGDKIGEIDPVEIWNRISDMSHKTADPGVIFIDEVNRYNPLIKDVLIECCNPCIVGDTLIATADGRNAVSIKQLAEENKNVSLYSTNINNSKIEIKTGRNPRKTGSKKEVWKVVLDDDSFFIATPNHKIPTKDGIRKVKDLQSGQSLFPFNSFLGHGYRNICNSGYKGIRNRRQYRLIYEYNYGDINSKIYDIHHKDFNQKNDKPENLVSILRSKHKKLHAEKMTGDKNPYHQMSKNWKYKFASKPGSKNRTYSGVTNSEMISAGKMLLKKHGKITHKIWKEFALDSRKAINHFPVNVHQDFRFGSFSNFKEKIIDNHKVKSVEFYGYEDVYNITVDDNHNYNIITSYCDENFIESSGICMNNCGEQFLTPFNCCNLSAINVAKFIRKNGTYDFNKLYNVVKKIAKLMDNAIDVMDYPDVRFETETKKYRPIGVGPMGIADALLMMNLKYDGADGRKLAGDIMRTITTACLDTSSDLARENGPFYNYDRYKEDFERIVGEHTGNDEKVMAKIRKYGARNQTVTTCMPTGTTALSNDASYGIEPLMGLVFRKNLISGETMHIINSVFESRFKRESWYSNTLLEKIAGNGGSLKGIHGIPKEVRDVFVVAHDINYKARIDMQAELQKYCSTAISSTINLPKDTTKEEISELFKYAYEKKLKGVTIYRDGSKEYQPVDFTNGKIKHEEFQRPNRLTSETFTVETGNGKMYVTISDDNGKPVEVFLYLGKSGQTLNTFTEALGRLFSLALQSGVPVSKLIKTLKGINSDSPVWHRFEPTDQKPAQILSIPDAVAKLLDKYYTENKNILNGSSDQVCPKCGLNLSAMEGCFTCICGFSKCA